jgi:dethiobiotin synthetase
MGQTTLLIAATDTEVGKTLLTTALAAYYQTHHPQQSLGLIKLIQCGRGDRERYEALFNKLPSIEIGDCLYFEAPLAPPIAAEMEGREVDLALVWKRLRSLQQRHSLVLAESLGGLGSPVTHELTVADLAGEWRLDTVLVAPVRLGAIAAIVANVALARQQGVKLRGIVLSCTQALTPEQVNHWTPIELIQSLTQLPVLGVLPYLGDRPSLETLAQAASRLTLEYL